ncbi:unnamed protein product [Allacma fusca]|uniref:CRAL-TRIO domain-containing protein n=1 Tax=Allacma fusca TaxID=39272 RepID=A0A8J2NXG8_9HEXA|nr:unnamed protein product [Allacma fusca]
MNQINHMLLNETNSSHGLVPAHKKSFQERITAENIPETFSMGNMDIKLFCISGVTILLIVTAEGLLKDSGKHRLSDEFYNTLFEVSSCCEIFKNFTLKNMTKWIDDSLSWEAPLELEQKFPFYQAGYDTENRPVWVFEIGKYDYKGQVAKGPEGIEELEKYLYRNTLIMLEVGHRQAERNKGASIKGISQALAIFDYDKFKLIDFIRPSTIAAFQEVLYTHSHLLNAVWSKVLMINLPFPPDLIKTVTFPILGPLVKKLKVYGRRCQWEPVLKRLIPNDSLPTWYGGSKDFKPIRIYG